MQHAEHGKRNATVRRADDPVDKVVDVIVVLRIVHRFDDLLA